MAKGLSRSTIDRRLASGEWRQLFHSVFLVDCFGARPSWDELDLETRAAAALLVHGDRAVLSHRTAAEMHGLPGPPYLDHSVHVTLPRGVERHQRPGIVLHFGDLGSSDRVRLGEGAVPCTSIERTLVDILRTWDEWAAVSALDAALAHGLVGQPDLSALWPMLHRRRGAVAARRRMEMGDGRSQSPLETRIRLIASAAGFPPDDLQHAVYDERGHLLGIGDMAWYKRDRRTLIAEADGREWHDVPTALFRDRRRANDFSGTGHIDIVRFTWEDSRRRQYIETVLRRHLGTR